MKTYRQNGLALAALCALMLCSACCATGGSGGERVRLFEPGKVRTVPAECFDEAAYLKRGYIKNTDAQGGVIYTRVPETDRKKDDTFIGGGSEGGGMERSWGGRAGRNVANFRYFDR